MINKEKIIPINVDLLEDEFASALDFFNAKWTDSQNASVIDVGKLANGGLVGDLHIAIFFNRIISVSSDHADVSEKTLGLLLDLFEIYQLKHRVISVNLVDCGTLINGPLSDFSVLRQKLEMIAGYVNERTRGHVYTIDFDGELEFGAPNTFFDTASEDFQNHVQSYLNETLSSLNQSFSGEHLSKKDALDSAEFDKLRKRLERDHGVAVQ